MTIDNYNVCKYSISIISVSVSVSVSIPTYFHVKSRKLFPSSLLMLKVFNIVNYRREAITEENLILCVCACRGDGGGGVPTNSISFEGYFGRHEGFFYILHFVLRNKPFLPTVPFERNVVFRDGLFLLLRLHTSNIFGVGGWVVGWWWVGVGGDRGGGVQPIP